MPNPDRTQVNEKYPHVPEAAAYELARSTDEPGPTVQRGGIQWPVNPQLDGALFEHAQRAANDLTRAQAATADVHRQWDPTTSDATKAMRDISAELAGWWTDKAASEIDMVVEKAVEYGGRGAAIDLLDMGHDLARMMGRKVTDQEATEIAIAIYVRGKIARIMAAIIEGRMPNVDSWLDLGIYARMAQRNREEGGWPFKPVD